MISLCFTSNEISDTATNCPNFLVGPKHKRRFGAAIALVPATKIRYVGVIEMSVDDGSTIQQGPSTSAFARY